MFLSFTECFSDPNVQRVIVIFSDGQSDDSLSRIYDAINFTINSYPPNNHAYSIMTYGLGNGGIYRSNDKLRMGVLV